MKKIRIIALVLFLVLAVWGLGGRISSSKEKVPVPTLFGAVSNTSNANVDSDKDGLSDADEKKWGTDPKNPDTDGDGFMDGQEVKGGYSPLVAAPSDKLTATSDHYSASNTNNNANNNANNNSNQNSNQNNNQNGNLNNNQANSTLVIDNFNQNADPLTSGSLTDKVASKVDDIIASYKLYSVSYDSVPADVQDKVKSEITDFTASLLKGTGLDFAFSIDENKILVDEKIDKDAKKYLEQVKSVLRKNGLISDGDTLEGGIKKIIDSLSQMRKSDIDLEKASIWKKEIDSSYNELTLMPINPDLKNLHTKVLHIVKSLGIVFDNIQEGDYFRSFLAAGRAEKINAELDAFSGEVKKSIQ